MTYPELPYVILIAMILGSILGFLRSLIPEEKTKEQILEERLQKIEEKLDNIINK